MSVNYHAFQSRNVLFPRPAQSVSSGAPPFRATILPGSPPFSGSHTTPLSCIFPTSAQTTGSGWIPAYWRNGQKKHRLKKKKAPPAMRPSAHSSRSPDARRGPNPLLYVYLLYFNETMAIYHLLKYTKDQPRTSGIWVPNTELDGASIRSRQSDPLLTPFSLRFTGKTPLLRRQCEALGGHALPVKGDAAYLFYAFPQIPLRLIFWDADEDFPAQTQVLVDSRITDYLHYESVGCVISDLLEKLEAGTSD